MRFLPGARIGLAAWSASASWHQLRVSTVGSCEPVCRRLTGTSFSTSNTLIFTADDTPDGSQISRGIIGRFGAVAVEMPHRR